MDNGATYRFAACALIVLLMAVLVSPAQAQGGSCPPNSLERAPAPYGTSPNSIKFCDMTSAAWQLFSDNNYPCGAGIAYHQPTYVGSNEYKLAIVPPSNMDFPGNTAVLQFYMAGNGAFGAVTDNIILRIRSHNPFGGQIGDTMTVSGNNFSRHQQGEGIVWQVTGLPVQAMQGGYWTVAVWEPIFLLGWGSIYISSIGIYPVGGTQPIMCPLAQLTPTPTPQSWPTQTPLPQTSPTPGQTPGTATPSPTAGTATPTAGPGTATTTPQATSTPWPTSAGGTAVPGTAQAPATISVQMPTPLPGVTWPAPQVPQIQFNMPEIPTVTPISQQIDPWPVPEIPTVDFDEIMPTPRTWVLTDTAPITGTMPVLIRPPTSGITVPARITITIGITPNPTIQSGGYVISDTVADVYIAATRWYTMTSGGAVVLANGDTGIGTAASAMSTFSENLTLPIRYIKSIQEWFPNVWPFIAFLMISFAWINFVYIGKFAVHNGGKFVELLRRLVDLIAQLVQMGPTALLIAVIVLIVLLLGGSLLLSL